MKPLLMAAALLVACAGIAQAQTAGDITVQSVWARATPPGAKTGVIYMTLTNKGTADDKLIAAATPVAAKAAPHIEIMDHGVMKMRPLKSVDLKPGNHVVLKPGGMHLMLTGLKQALTKGHGFPLTLQFEHAPAMTVQVEVAKIGAAGMSDHGMGDMDSMKHE